MRWPDIRRRTMRGRTFCAPPQRGFVHPSSKPLDGKEVIAAYEAKFGSYSRTALKSASAMQATQPLLAQMQAAVNSGKPMDFGSFVTEMLRPLSHVGSADG